MKKAFLCVALSFLCIVPVWSADEPDYSSLPFGMEYLGPAINVYPAEAAKDYIEVLYHDGIQAAFRYGNGPERFFDDVESIPTIEILYTIACQEDFTGHRYVLPETCERDMEFLFWKYPELQIAFDQPDFSRELLHLYKICSCKEYQVPLGSNIISNALAPVIARNQTLKEIEYLLIYNQLVHGEYSFFEKQAMVSAFEQAGGIWIPISAYLSQGVLGSPYAPLYCGPYSTYLAYVRETGRFSCRSQLSLTKLLLGLYVGLEVLAFCMIIYIYRILFRKHYLRY